MSAPRQTLCKRGHALRGPDADVRLNADGRPVCRRCTRLRRAQAIDEASVAVELTYDPERLATLAGIAQVPLALFPKVNPYFGWFGNNAAPGDCAAAFVGEKLRDDQPADTAPLFWGRTGGFLFRTLRALSQDYQDCYWTNAVKPDGSDVLRDELLELVLADRVIALGQVASQALEAASVPHVVIPHPSWWLRFNAQARDEYQRILRDAWVYNGNPGRVESQA